MDDRLRRSEIRDFTTAMNRRWEIDPQYKQVMIGRLVRIIADPNSTPREVTSASRALIAAEGQNQHDEPIPEQRRRSIIDLLDRVRTLEVIDAVPIEREGEDPDTLEEAGDGDDEESRGTGTTGSPESL